MLLTLKSQPVGTAPPVTAKRIASSMRMSTIRTAERGTMTVNPPS